MSVGRFLQQAAAGNAGEAVYVDDVFSTYLYDGATTSRTIDNGIDLAGEGGMVWLKQRSGTRSPAIFDTERGDDIIYTDGTGAQSDSYVSSFGAFTFSSTGFSTGTAPVMNENGYTHASWTFRKQPGFFDVVTWTGDGTSNRNISHNLNSVPGAILIKRTDSASSTGWMVWHRSGSPQSGTYGLMLNYNNSWGNIGGDLWGTSGPNMTSTTFSVGNYSDVNASGGTYVAYLFAHDAQDFGTDSDESIIKCGSYTGTGSAQDIDLGFEPQWLLVKSSSTTDNWRIIDVMRGWTADGLQQNLNPNATFAENSTSTALKPTADGFSATGSNMNNSGVTYIYVAIRRPQKPAEELAATDLFTTVVGSGNPGPNFVSGFPVDMFWQTRPASSDTNFLSSRLMQGKYLETNSTNAEATSSYYVFNYQNGVTDTVGFTTNRQAWMFRRAPGFFDVVAYTGSAPNATTTTPTSYSHNLGVAPELIIIKHRNLSANWFAWYSGITSGYYLRPNLTNANVTGGSNNPFNSSVVQSADSFQVTGTINDSNYNYIAYLFASVSGISKVGTYSGTGSDVNVDCGFSAGARFVLVKRTDSTGDWYYWDTERGIVAGNDPYLFLNTNAVQVTSTDYIDPLSSGFTITSSAPAALNASGGNYLFLAIA